MVHDDPSDVVTRWEAASVDQSGIVELLVLAVGDYDGLLDRVVRRYRDDPSASLLAARSGQDLVAVVGFAVSLAQLTILHIATAPDVRRTGIATALLAELARQNSRGLPMSAETDSDAVGFYRANGFTITSLGEKYPGVERFQAVRHPAPDGMRAVTVGADDETSLHVGVVGSGPDVVVLSGGPGCVNYLENSDLAPCGFRTWFPEPRGVGRSGGGPHDLAQAIADLETMREAMGVNEWIAVGHSSGSDLAVRYALDHPERVRAVIGVAGHGLHKDRTWSKIYEAARHTEDEFVIEWEPAVHESLKASFDEWIHEPQLFRQLADSDVAMTFVAAGDDIRPDWPLRQLAALVPRAQFREVVGVPHNFWGTHPSEWTQLMSSLCRAAVEATEPGISA